MSSRRPHFAWFFLAVLPFAAGIFLAVRFFIGMMDDIDSMQRFDVPGEHEVYLPSGDYIVFSESGEGWSGRCRLTDSDGAEISLGSPSGRTTYTMGGRSGVSVMEFTAPRETGYRLACQGDHGVLAIGKGLGLTIVGMIVAPIGGMLLAGLTVVLVYLWRRRSP